jgi:hypothetical protein
MVEYRASNFGGELQGDLLAASFNGSVIRYKLNATGDAVVLQENLVNFATPLDVTAQGDGDVFPGTIWTANHTTDSISVYEPNDFDPFVCTGAYNAALDEDGDGFNNADEIDNGTDPCSAGSLPPDVDGDFISDLNDPDDDNDGILDTVDRFAIDPDDGLTTAIPVSCPADEAITVTGCLRFASGSVSGTLLNLGFTGLMTNQVDDYLNLFDPDDLITGGASPDFTVQNTPTGDALDTSNDQRNGFQFGVAPHTGPFTVHTRVSQPFPVGPPTDFQSVGVAIGPGDQANYAKLVIAANGGAGGIEFGSEVADIFTGTVTPEPGVLGNSVEIDLYLTMDPNAATDNVAAAYSIDGGPLQAIGTASVPVAWFDGTQAVAVGVISTSRGATPFPATWGLLEVYQDDGVVAVSGAEMTVTPNSGNINASTFTSNSMVISNTSVGKKVTKVTIDLSTGLLPDVVFDPNGTAGDVGGTPKGFTIDSLGGTGTVGHTFLSPHDGIVNDGFDVLEITFTDFDPGEALGFSIDIDPTSIQGVGAPGPGQSGSISGLEMTGATVTFEFDDTSTLVAQAFGDGSLAGSKVVAQEAAPPALTSMSIAGVPSPPAVVPDPAQTVDIVGPAGASVELIVVEGALFLTGVPGGGYDLDPFEANSAIQVTFVQGTIAGDGTLSLGITLTNTDPDGGLNYIVGAVVDAGGNAGPVSGPIVLQF